MEKINYEISLQKFRKKIHPKCKAVTKDIKLLPFCIFLKRLPVQLLEQYGDWLILEVQYKRKTTPCFRNVSNHFWNIASQASMPLFNTSLVKHILVKLPKQCLTYWTRFPVAWRIHIQSSKIVTAEQNNCVLFQWFNTDSWGTTCSQTSQICGSRLKVFVDMEFW